LEEGSDAIDVRPYASAINKIGSAAWKWQEPAYFMKHLFGGDKLVIRFSRPWTSTSSTAQVGESESEGDDDDMCWTYLSATLANRDPMTDFEAFLVKVKKHYGTYPPIL
jgi:hypothetical protein